MNLIDIIDQNTLYPLAGGIHPPQMKRLSNQTAISRLPLADEYLVPLPQVGDSALLIVKVGDHVLKGQPLTQAAGAMYSAVHAPTSGTITHIEPRASNHASGLPQLTSVIKADGQDREVAYQPANLAALTKEQLLSRIRDAGINGMGGAMFPSQIKLNPANKIELLIINGVECEPYITSDDRLMREHADGIVAGVEIIQQLLQAKRIIVAIEDNKPEAASAMAAALASNSAVKAVASVRVIPTKYPSGGEKQLIQILTGQEVPSGSIPAQLGIVVHNVGTSLAIRDAVLDGKPLLERVVTVTGNNIKQNANYWLPIGTPITHVLRECGMINTDAAQVIVGGPMMGYTLFDANVPVLKGTNCLLVPAATELNTNAQERACIRCGECAQVCPADLLPQQLYWHAKAEEYDKATAFNLQDCIECGCCAYVCPSDIPLVEYYRVAKAAIRRANADKVQADQAKIRYEARIERLEQEKQAREAKAREAADRRKAVMSGGEKDAVAAALARVQAKKAQQAAESAASTTTTEADTPAPKKPANDAIAAAVARAKAKKAQLASSDTAVATKSETTDASDKKSQVAAAIARAKAKKAQMAASDDAVTTQADTQKAADTANDANTDEKATAPATNDKQAQIAAAIARAKAKKQANAATESQHDNSLTEQPAKASEPVTATDAEATTAPNAADTAKKARIAAAKKSGDTASATPTEPANATDLADTAPAVDAKQARIAAAVAKAKVKKAQEHAADTVDTAVDGSSVTNETPVANEPAAPAVDAKQARIAAAVAKAKAKKAQAQTTSADKPAAEASLESQATPAPAATVESSAAETTTSGTNNAEATETTDESQNANVPPAAPAADSKQARIAAAIAKAKAKKAQADADKENQE